ncbi:hypothetical protein ACJQWK_04929 [Exserohilum turcicum]|uniref:Uncharacterized protein n=1 Tax=Exserohilum turcicum (strain 28A) TaxID=671987 RepID=R0K1W7_EXST2|nr:uncharacterized protein SETTUDRAFT_22418 [Exserohilum turcica Et28A]EOA82427.1 hypothetical protein SETTUDRAFT_22418 [Exserohilum turcica Et28A]
MRFTILSAIFVTLATATPLGISVPLDTRDASSMCSPNFCPCVERELSTQYPTAYQYCFIQNCRHMPWITGLNKPKKQYEKDCLKVDGAPKHDVDG